MACEGLGKYYLYSFFGATLGVKLFGTKRPPPSELKTNFIGRCEWKGSTPVYGTHMKIVKVTLVIV